MSPSLPTLEQLGITFIAARSHKPKAASNKLWGVPEDRLTNELRLAQACDLHSANAVLTGFIATTTAASRVVRGRPPLHGVPLPQI